MVMAEVNSTVILFGANFGAGGRTSVTIAGSPATIITTESSHDHLAVLTPYCQGLVAVTVAGVTSGSYAYNYRYRDQLLRRPCGCPSVSVVPGCLCCCDLQVFGGVASDS